MRLSFLLLALIAGCSSQSSDSYLPLSNQTTLTYALTQIKSGNTLQQKLLTAFRGPIELQQKQVYQQFTASGPKRLIQHTDKGIIEVGIYQNSKPRFLNDPILLLPEPLTENDIWQAPLTTHLLEWRKHSNDGRNFRTTLIADFHCESIGETITTPAGTFSGLARIRATGEKVVEYGSLQKQAVIRIEQTQWYAPGIGLIRSQRQESANRRDFNTGEAAMILERID